jgi:hypothetical protein
MLAHCPLRIGLVVVGLATLVAALSVTRELRQLRTQQRACAASARGAGAVVPARPIREPLQTRRLIGLFLPILAGQVALTALVTQLWPMTLLMQMHGSMMAMTLPGAVPPVPLHGVVALLLAVCTWRMERRFRTLRASIALMRRLLARMLHTVLPVVLPSPPATPSLRDYGGPAALSRPPPSAAPGPACAPQQWLRCIITG